MVEYDHWKWNCSRNNQDWGSNSNIIKSRYDIQLQDQLVALNDVSIRGVEMMRQVQEKSFETVQMVKEIEFDDECEPLEEIEEMVQES